MGGVSTSECAGTEDYLDFGRFSSTAPEVGGNLAADLTSGVTHWWL